MRQTIFVKNKAVFSCCIQVVCSILFFSLGGCVNDETSGWCEERRMSDDYTAGRNGGEVPTLPPSAEKRLLDALGGYGIIDISELAYQSGRYSFLGIEGSFAVSWGSVFHYSYVLRKDSKESSWMNAKIYKWKPSLITYEDNSGEIINVGINSVSSLVALPDKILTNYLWEITNVPEESVWTTDEHNEWCRRMSRMQTERVSSPTERVRPPKTSLSN